MAFTRLNTSFCETHKTRKIIIAHRVCVIFKEFIIHFYQIKEKKTEKEKNKTKNNFENTPGDEEKRNRSANIVERDPSNHKHSLFIFVILSQSILNRFYCDASVVWLLFWIIICRSFDFELNHFLKHNIQKCSFSIHKQSKR